MKTPAADVAAAMDGLGLPSSVVVGHSMGAFVAAALAADHPDRVAGVVLIDGGLPLQTPPGIPVEQLLEAALAMQVGRLRRVFSSEDEYMDFWRAQAPFGGGRWNSWVEHYLRYDLRPVDGGWQPKASEAAVRADSFDTADSEAIRYRLEAATVPVLLLRAEEGFNPGDPPLFPADAAQRDFPARPGFTDRVIPGSTHYTITLGEEQASMVADALVAFAVECGR
jgi:pimeloyl-ACP methyl ester carboxylesterase